jgi:UDP-glucose 4-epimerase
MRVFLTGVSGYLGSLLAEHLERVPEVQSITGIALAEPSVRLPSKAKFVKMDIRSPRLAEAMAGHDIVVHTAAVVFWCAKMTEQERDDINLNGTLNVAQAARTNHVRRFIHASSMGAYDPSLVRGETKVTESFPLGRERSPFYYWNSKAAAERILTETLPSSGVSLTCFRPIYIMGPRNHTIESYRKNAVRFPGQNPRRQFVHEDDVAAAFVRALQTEMPGAYNVVPDDYIRLSDLWRIVGAKRVPIVPLPVVRLITWVRWRFFGSKIHPSWVEDMLVDFTGSNAKLKSTGWKPRYLSEEALRASLSF